MPLFSGRCGKFPGNLSTPLIFYCAACRQDYFTSEVVLSDWPTPACVFLCRAAVMALFGGWTDAGDRATPLAAEGGAHR